MQCDMAVCSALGAKLHVITASPSVPLILKTSVRNYQSLQHAHATAARPVIRNHRQAGRKLSWHLAACPRAKQLWRTHASSGSRLLTKLQPGGRSGRSSTGIAFAPSNHTLQHGFVMSGSCCKQSQMRDGHMHAMHDESKCYFAVKPSIIPWQGWHNNEHRQETP